MRHSRTGSESLLRAMMRLVLLLGPVSSSDSGLPTGSSSSAHGEFTQLKELNIKDLVLDPGCSYADAPPHHGGPSNDANAYKASTFICARCGSTDAGECVLTKLGRKVRRLVATGRCEEASESFRVYLKDLRGHEEIPPTFPGDDIEICWKSLLRFIMLFIQNQDKDGINVLTHVLGKYKDLPPFQLKNIVVSDADFWAHRKVAKSDGIEYKRKLEDCNLLGISVLYEGHTQSSFISPYLKEEGMVKAYSDALINILLYSMNIQKLEASEQRGYLSCDISGRVGALKITDFMQFLIKEFIPVSAFEYADLTPYKDDESVFEAFKSVVQKVIDGKSTMINTENLLSWCLISYCNGMIKKALDQNFQVSFENLAEYVISMVSKGRYLGLMERLEEDTNSFFPFKLENIIVSCADFSKAEGPLFEKVRDSSKGNTGHKKLSECSLFEFKFLCQLYKLNERTGSNYLIVGYIIKKLFWDNVRKGNIPQADTDILPESFVFEENRDNLESMEILILLERNMISFSEFFKALESRKDARIIVFDPLHKEMYEVVEDGKEFKYWKELARCNPGTKVFENALFHFLEVSDLVKILEACSKDKDVMTIFSRILFEVRRVFYLDLKKLAVDGDDALATRHKKRFLNLMQSNISPKDLSHIYNKFEKRSADCSPQKMVTLFHAHKSDDNEEVNRLLGYILLCCVKIGGPVKEDLSRRLPECFFAHARRLPSERLYRLVEAGIVPARLVSNPPVSGRSGVCFSN